MDKQDPGYLIADYKQKQPTRTGAKVAIGIASWLTVLVFGAIVSVINVLLSVLLLEPRLFSGVESTDQLLTVRVATAWTILMVVTIVGTFLLIRRIKSRFLRYAKIPLLLGLVPVLIIFGAGLASISVLYVDTNTASTCMPIRDRLDDSRSAVYAIQGDNGSAGSSVAVSTDGKLLTNAHVIEGATALTTWAYEGEKLVEKPVHILSIAADKDLALLKIDLETPYYLRLSSQYTAGDEVYAIGFPGNAFSGGDNTVSKGIVSRIVDEEYNPELAGGMEYIQTDAAINPGNSGGPLVGSCGLVGINTIISDFRQTDGLLREEGIGYAVSARVISETFKLPITP